MPERIAGFVGSSLAMTFDVVVLDNLKRRGSEFALERLRASGVELHMTTYRMRAKLKEVKGELRQRMHQSIPEQGRWLKQIVTGYFVGSRASSNDLLLSHPDISWKVIINAHKSRCRTDCGRIAWKAHSRDGWNRLHRRTPGGATGK